ncbi:MAG: VanZ family protein [Clostridium sp.]|nr:VanZ family protein [Clostridium sp.]
MGDFGFGYTIILLIFFMIWIIYRTIVIKKNKLNIIREIFVNLFFIYFLMMIYYTFFKNGELCFSFYRIRYVNFIPIKRTIEMFANVNTGYTCPYYNVLGNIILFIPLGFFIPLLFKKCDKLKRVILYGFIGSFTIEFLQYFTSNNITDIDDLIFNTIGAILGFWCFRLVRCVVGKTKLINILEKIQDTKTDKIIKLAVKPLGIMLVVIIIFSGVSGYFSTYSAKALDEELSVMTFQNSSKDLLTKDFKEYKFVLQNDGGRIELYSFKKVLINRYAKNYGSEMSLDGKVCGYNIDILMETGNKGIFVVYGKNNSSSKISIEYNGEEHEEDILPNEEFIIVYPHDINFNEGNIKDIYNSDNYDIKFINEDGSINKDIPSI